MMKHEVFTVEATLLCDETPRLDFDRILAVLNRLLEKRTGWTLELTPSEDTAFALLSNDHVHATISVVSAPRAREALSMALCSPLAEARETDFEALVATHQAHVLLQVGDDSTPLPPDAQQMMAGMGVVRACPPELKMELLHWLMQVVAASARPSLIHVGPSDLIATADDLAACRSMSLPVPLLIHPVPGQLRHGPGDATGYGLRVTHAPRLCGREIEIEGIPADMPVEEACRLAARIVAGARRGHVCLDEGTELTDEGPAPLHVTRRGEGQGTCVVSFWDEPAGAYVRTEPQAAPGFDPLAALAPMRRIVSRLIPRPAEGESAETPAETAPRARQASRIVARLIPRPAEGESAETPVETAPRARQARRIAAFGLIAAAALVFAPLELLSGPKTPTVVAAAESGQPAE